VNEGAHQSAGRNAAPEAVAAQAQVGLLFEPHGHRLVAQWTHRRPPAYTSPPLLAPPRQAAYFLDLGGATYLEAIYPSTRPVIGRSSRSSSLLEAPFRDGNRYRNPSGSYMILCPQIRLRRSSRCYSLSYTVAIVCARMEKLYEQSFSAAGRHQIWTFHDRWYPRHDVASRAARCCRSRPSGRRGSTLSPKRSHQGPQRTRGVRRRPPVPP
jgi:hypothetical protein